MKVIVIPKPVTVSKPRIQGRSIEFIDEERTFLAFLQESIDAYDLFSKGHVNSLVYRKLTETISKADLTKGEIWFEDEDFKKLEAATEAATWQTPKINAAYIPFREAIKGARTEVIASDKAS